MFRYIYYSFSNVETSTSEPANNASVSKRDVDTPGPTPTHGTYHPNTPTKPSHNDGARRSYYSALDTFHEDFTNYDANDANDANDDDSGCLECCYNNLENVLCNNHLYKCIKGIKCFIMFI